MNIIYNYEDTVASCIIRDNQDNVYYGMAVAHPDDIDMANEKTGLTIAKTRAQTQFITYKISQLREQLKSLQHLENCMLQSKHYNQKSYEARMLHRQIKIKENQIKTLVNERLELREDLYRYLQKKEEFYKKIRKQRKENK